MFFKITSQIHNLIQQFLKPICTNLKRKDFRTTLVIGIKRQTLVFINTNPSRI